MEFRILGPLEVVLDGRAVELRAAKVRALLGMLLVSPNQVVSADRMADGLWGDDRPDSAVNTLQGYVSQLRKSLGGDQIQTRPPGYVLAAAAELIDVSRFERFLEEGRRARSGGDPERSVTVLAQALGLWRGKALADFAYAEWAQPEIARLEELHVVAIDEWIEARLDLGQHSEVLGELDALVITHPLRERLWGHRMLALYRSGRQAESLRTYGQLRRVLGEQLGIEPSRDLARLEEAILLQKSELDWRPTAQLLRSSMRSQPSDRRLSPPDAALAVPTNLPLSVSRFVGRERDLDGLRAELRSTRVLTLTGVGGVGKTRLALELARTLLEDHPDGVYWVELSSLQDPLLAPERVASTLGLTLEATRSATDAIVAHVGERQILIVLDNCEHMVEACAQLTHLMIQANPRLRILATSREPLSVTGETVRLVPSLSENDAVRLFQERAIATTRDPEGITGTDASVVEICRRLDCIPLAIELAAARTSVLSPAEIAQGLEDRFALLGTGPRTAPPRHQTLRAALDWSYAALSDVERTLFSGLSVFAGGFSLSAAQAVCSSEALERSQVLDVLAALVHKSLVVAVQRAGLRTRYGMLETVGEYASEKLAESGQGESYRGRHLGWAVALAEHAEPFLIGGGAARCLEELDLEHDNLRAALGWARSQGSPLGLRLAGALGYFWEGRDQREGRAWLTDFLSSVDSVPSGIRAKALNAAGLLDERRGDHGAADKAYRQGLALYRQLDDALGAAWSLRGLGNAALAQGALQSAISLHEECLEIGREQRHSFTTVVALINLGSLAILRGDVRQAGSLLDEALQLCRATDDDWGAAWSLFHLGQLATTMGEYDCAGSRLRESLALYDKLGIVQGVASATAALGAAAMHEGDFENARRFQHHALDLQRGSGDDANAAWTRCDIGERLRAEGALVAAEQELVEALATCRRVVERNLETRCLLRLGRLRRTERVYDGAIEVQQEALKLACRLDNAPAIAESREELAMVATASGEHRKAALLFGLGQRLRDEIAVPRPRYLRDEYQQALNLTNSRLDARQLESAARAASSMDPRQPDVSSYPALTHSSDDDA